MPTRGTESEVVENLVAAAAGGDRKAQERLIGKYWPLIKKVVRERIKRSAGGLDLRAAPDDLDQEVALRLLIQLPKHEWQSRTAFVAWVKRLADNRVRDVRKFHQAARRDKGAETVEEKVDASPLPRRSAESVMDQDRELAKLRVFLDQLKDEYSIAVQMNMMGFAHAEIADSVNCTPEAARKLVARGLSKLHDLMAASEQ